MKHGDRGNVVLELHKDLARLGYAIKLNDVYDRSTIEVVKRFQTDHMLPSSGVVDNATKRSIVDMLNLSSGRSYTLPNESTLPVVDKTTLSVVYIVTRNHVTKAMDELLAMSDKLCSTYWHLVVVIESNQPLTQEQAVEFSSTTAQRTNIIVVENWHYEGLNKAFNLVASESAQYVYPVMASDTVMADLVQRVWPLVVTNKHSLVVCDWINATTGQVVSAQKDSPLWEQAPIGSVIFDKSLLVPGSEHVRDLKHHSDTALWFSWVFSGHKVTPINWTVCTITRTPINEPSWVELRSEFYTRRNKSTVSALMITGKNDERYPMARVAVECFHNQSWQNKELIIINHGAQPVCKQKQPNVKEIFVTKGERTLGDLRNWSIDAASGHWCMVWDDDDWHHPNRMELQMDHGKSEHIITFMWQVRCSMSNNSAFYDKMPHGQQMSVMFERSTPCRYMSLECREDTKFIEWFGDRTVVINNHVGNVLCDPTQYIRFYHGRNIWDYTHVMHGSDAKNVPVNDHQALIPAHAHLLTKVIERYMSEPGFSTLP
jgi:hypothetical protein